MAKKDLHNYYKGVLLEIPATQTATFNSDSIDLQDFEASEYCVTYGTSNDAFSGALYWSAKLQESDASGSGFTDVAAAHVVATTASNVFAVVNDPADDGAMYSIGYQGKKRYVRVVVTETGAMVYGCIIGVHVDLYNLRYAPDITGENQT